MSETEIKNLDPEKVILMVLEEIGPARVEEVVGECCAYVYIDKNGIVNAPDESEYEFVLSDMIKDGRVRVVKYAREGYVNSYLDIIDLPDRPEAQE